MNFKGKNVLITGGASGIGKIMARKSLERGAGRVIIWDINEQGLRAVSEEFLSRGWPVQTFTVDISSAEEIKKAATATLAEVGTVDILINNAGVVTGKYFQDHSHQDIERNMRVNALAPMHITLEFLPPMLARNSGAVCNIASAAGLISNPKMSVYAASKWAAVGWSESLRLEMEQQSKAICFTTVMPFYISTGMFDGVKSRLLPILKPEKVSEKIMRAMESNRNILSMPLPYWFIRFSQGILPTPLFDWMMRHVFGIYDTMKDFKGRG